MAGQSAPERRAPARSAATKAMAEPQEHTWHTKAPSSSAMIPGVMSPIPIVDLPISRKRRRLGVIQSQ